MVDKVNELNESKVDIEQYTGIVSTFLKRAFWTQFKNWMTKRNFTIPSEVPFLASLIAYILFDYRYGHNFWLLPILGVLLILNLLLINIPNIKKGYFKTKDEKLDFILKEETEKALIGLGNFLNNQTINLVQFKKIFSEKFKDNYKAYTIVFGRDKLSEEKIKFLLDNNFISYDFVDDYLIRLMIKKISWGISFPTYKKMAIQLKDKGLSRRTIKIFNYKFLRYYKTKNKLKRFLHFFDLMEPIVSGLSFVSFIFVSILSFTLIIIASYKKNDLNELNGIFGIYLIMILLSPAIYILIKIIKYFIISTVSSEIKF